jgi:O-antigen/teichoic acid export membrane protein
LVEIDVIGQLVGLAVMIVAAIYTRSIWALVSGGIVSALVVTVLSHVWMSGMPNRLRLEKEALIELFGFGKWIIASSALTVFAAGGDRLLLGGLIAAHDFGLYVIAAVIVRAGEGAVGSLFGVSLSALSEIARSDRSKLVSVYYRLSLPLEILLLFLAGFLFAAGHSVIKVLYDSRYEQAGPILEVLALSLIPIKYGVAQQAYLAVGKPNWLTVVNVVRCASLYGLVPLLYSLSGPQGALWGIAVHGFAVIPVCYIFNARIGLVKVRREVGPFVLLPVGYFAGAAVNYFVG